MQLIPCDKDNTFSLFFVSECCETILLLSSVMRYVDIFFFLLLLLLHVHRYSMSYLILKKYINDNKLRLCCKHISN